MPPIDRPRVSAGSGNGALATALTMLSVTYIAGIVIVTFMEDERPREVAA